MQHAVSKTRSPGNAQEVHGHARVPHDYSDYSQPGWVMAGRWLQKNAKLFLKDKLPDKRYALIQDILGARAEAALAKPVLGNITCLSRSAQMGMYACMCDSIPQLGTALGHASADFAACTSPLLGNAIYGPQECRALMTKLCFARCLVMRFSALQHRVMSSIMIRNMQRSPCRAGIKFVKQYGGDPLAGVPNKTKKGGKIRLGAVRLEGSDTLHSPAAGPDSNPNPNFDAGSLGEPMDSCSAEMGAEASAPAASSASGEPGGALLAGARVKLDGAAESSSCADRDEAPRIDWSEPAQSSISSREGEVTSSAAAERAGSSGSGNHGWWSHAPHRGRGARARGKADREQRRPPAAFPGKAGLTGSRGKRSSRGQSRAPPASAGTGTRGRGGGGYGGGHGHHSPAASAAHAGNPGKSARPQGRASSPAEEGGGGGQRGADRLAAGNRGSKGALGAQGAAAPPQSRRQTKIRTAAQAKEGPKKQKQRAQPVLVF